MSPANARLSKMRGGAITYQTIVGIVMVIGVLIVLYYLYQWLLKSDPNSMGKQVKMTVATDDIAQLDSMAAQPTVDGSRAFTWNLDGGQYSATFWIYISDSKRYMQGSSATNLAHLFEITSAEAKGRSALVIALNPKDGTLVVRQGTSDPSERIDNSLSSRQGTNYPASDLIANYNNGNVYTVQDKCDIPNGIEYQRWVLVGVAANGRTLDVYIDGKLARSCVYKAGFALGSDKATINMFTNSQGKLSGQASRAFIYNYALNPEEMWRVYMAGPGGPFSLWKWLTSFIQVTATIDGQSLNTLTPCAACAKDEE